MSPAQRHDVEVGVVAAMRGLSEIVVDAGEVSSTLQRIAALAAAAIPGADGVGISVVQPVRGAGPAEMIWATADAFVREMDHLQYEICLEGPCLSAVRTMRPQISGSLGSDGRWPRFGGRAARQNVHAALSQPLVVRNTVVGDTVVGDTVVGALNVFARRRDALTPHAQRVAQRFAVPAAVSVANLSALTEAHSLAGHLEAALRSRPIIDQAIGIMRSRTGGDTEEALRRLRQLSQQQNRKLSAIAQHIVDEAVRRADARHARA